MRHMFYKKAIVACCATIALFAACNGNKRQGLPKPSDLKSLKSETPEPIALKDTILDSDDGKISAEYPGGLNELRAYIKQHLKYPKIAQDAKLEGRVIVRTCITSKGKISGCRILTSDNDLFNDEAFRVVKSLPKFTPATLHERPISDSVNIVVMFRLDR